MRAPFNGSLFELSLTSSDPVALSDFYERALGYVFAQDASGQLGLGRDRRLRIVAGSRGKLNYAAFAADSAEDLAALETRLEIAGVAIERFSLPGMCAPAIAFADPDGNRFVFGVGDAVEMSASDAMQGRPARLQHLVFASLDAARLAAFYRDVLGFVLSDTVLDNAGGLRTAFLRCSNDHHSLAVFAAPENRLDHHCLEVGDWGLIRDWSDHFASERIPLKWGPGRHGPGNNLFVFIHDPDGNWVELSAELEQIASAREPGVWPHEERTLNSWGIGLLRS